MKKQMILTVLVCVAVLVAAALLSGYWNNAPRIGTIRVGFVYSEDESTPYTANFVQAQRALKEEYGDRRKALRAKVREIFEAGLEALKERRKPSKKPSKTGKPKKERKNRIIDKPPENNRQHKRGGGNVDEMDVFDDDSLERFIQADLRRNRK